jgi:hypothetical protein
VFSSHVEQLLVPLFFLQPDLVYHLFGYPEHEAKA